MQTSHHDNQLGKKAVLEIVFIFLILAVTSLAATTAKAEYRVFNLQITSPDGTSVRTELSTLDPDQYRGYHTVKEGEKIVYTDTWRCRGNTSDFKDFCPNPKAVAPVATAETPATQP